MANNKQTVKRAKPTTAAERQAASRAKRAHTGEKQIAVWLEKDAAEGLARLMDARGETATAIINRLLIRANRSARFAH
jgi:hypothetical protein